MVYYVLGHLITLIECSVSIIVLFFKREREWEKTEEAPLHVCGGGLLLLRFT
ncbi:hypothetical protein [Rossellomorea sp. KS-H15a]|uniref:hypothetical protein n=1 Tax=Rossellomorea sp. KS-H15a TaxID=2963940 RepID=UPI0020C61713|nr:hypothetical protein [Rossellomorea sp. KS-H15a]UTE78607.1 hypothetical protein M1J35_07565 [Rossellomorea sp. KS-H15a]